MKEIEVLVRVEEENTNKVLEKLKLVSEFKNKSNVYDIYFYDPLKKNLSPNEKMELKEAFRLRRKKDKNYMTYKVDKFDDNGKWLYSEENETEIESFDEAKLIIKRLGLEKLVIVDMEKYFFENNNYKIAVEFVKDLGCFLEVESKNLDVADINKERKKIIDFIDNLDFKLSEDVGIGKPELLIKKNGVV
jgi:adenylate cyclase, class 2